MSYRSAPVTQPNTITIETRGAIEILTLNRPRELNAVTPEMIGELADYFAALHDRPAIRVVILRGNGREFCAGAELGSDAFAAPGKGRPQRQLIPPPKRLESIASCLFRGRNGSPHGTRNVIRLRPSDSERGPRWSNATRTR